MCSRCVVCVSTCFQCAPRHFGQENVKLFVLFVDARGICATVVVLFSSKESQVPRPAETGEQWEYALLSSRQFFLWWTDKQPTQLFCLKADNKCNLKRSTCTPTMCGTSLCVGHYNKPPCTLSPDLLTFLFFFFFFLTIQALSSNNLFFLNHIQRAKSI